MKVIKTRTPIGFQHILQHNFKRNLPALESGFSIRKIYIVISTYVSTRTRIGFQRKVFNLFITSVCGLYHLHLSAYSASVYIFRIRPQPLLFTWGCVPHRLRVYPLRGTPHVYYLLHKNLKFSVHIQLKAVRHKVY